MHASVPVANDSLERMYVHPFAASHGGMPLVVEPIDDRSPEGLRAWLLANESWVQQQMRHYGAMLFRGFAVREPQQFEGVARAIDNNLKKDYLGTSPRNAVTEFVFNASEVPGPFPIPQHCEMSFVKNFPQHLFFCCLQPSPVGGETPLVDFRRVYAELDPVVRQRFDERGIKAIRNYAGPDVRKRFDFWQLKPWDEMFGTRDHAAVEAKCREEEFEPTWGENDSLRLVSRHQAMRRHAETGEPVWFNHSSTFHVSMAPGEYKHIWKRRKSLRNLFFWQLSRLMIAARRRLIRSEDQSMHCTYLDGAEIPDADMEHLRDVIWQNMVIYPWQLGDIVAIDNQSVGHGRLPYRGPRRIAVCWA